MIKQRKRNHNGWILSIINGIEFYDDPIGIAFNFAFLRAKFSLLIGRNKNKK